MKHIIITSEEALELRTANAIFEKYSECMFVEIKHTRLVIIKLIDGSFAYSFDKQISCHHNKHNDTFNITIENNNNALRLTCGALGGKLYLCGAKFNITPSTIVETKDYNRHMRALYHISRRNNSHKLRDLVFATSLQISAARGLCFKSSWVTIENNVMEIFYSSLRINCVDGVIYSR